MTSRHYELHGDGCWCGCEGERSQEALWIVYNKIFSVEMFVSRSGSIKDWKTNPCVTVHEYKARRFMTKGQAVRFLKDLFSQLTAEMRDGWVVRRYNL